MPDTAIVDIVSAIQKLSAEQRSEIVAKLSASAAAPGKLMSFSQSMLAAAGNPQRLTELRELRATVARHALVLDESKPVDLAELTQRMQAQGVPTQMRMVIKAMLFRCGMCAA